MPTIAPDIVITPADTAVVIDPLANDQGDGLTLAGFTQPAHGTVAGNADGTLTYTPAAGFAGVDSFQYTAQDATGQTATATITVSVLAANATPVATDDEAATTPGTSVDIPVLLNDSDPDGEALTIVALGMPSHGSVQIRPGQVLRYTPQPGFVGLDSFTYSVADAAGEVATARVTVYVRNANMPPVAQPDSASTTVDTPVDIAVLANDRDDDGDPLSLVALTVPAHGRIAVGTNRHVTYTPDAGFEGEDRFAYTIRDDRGETATATVTVSVIRPNAAPTAVADVVETSVDTPVTFAPTANDTDPDGDPLRFLALTLPAHGGLTLNADGSLTYTPDPGHIGEDGFAYTIGDGRGGTAEGEIRIVITGQPVFANGYSHRRRLLIPPRQAPATVTDFVLFVDEQGDWLRSQANGGHVESDLGFDLRFELEDGTRLDHEIDGYDPVMGRLRAWVRIPAWDQAQSLHLFLYYGKPGLTASEANPAGVWQGYLAVWDTASGHDRSGNGRHLTLAGVAHSELIGASGRFNGDADARLDDGMFLSGLGALYIQAVVQADPQILGTRNARIIQQGDPAASAGSQGLSLFYHSSGYFGGAPQTVKFALMTADGSVQLEGPGGIQSSGRQVLAAAWQAGTLPRLYVNGEPVTASWVGLGTPAGAQAGAVAHSATSMVAGQPLSVGLGTLNPANSWIGLIDEVRISASVPAAERIAAEAHNLLDPTAFYGIGDGEQFADGTESPVAAPLSATTTPGQWVELDPLPASYLPAGTSLGLGQPPQHGVVSLIDNRIRYTPSAGFTGSDRFTYTLTNGTKTAEARVDVAVDTTPKTMQPADPPSALRTINVADDAQLSAAIASARPGDHIVLADGDYSGVTINLNGTAQNPIVIRAANQHAARFTDRVVVTGSHVWLYKLHFDGPNSYSLSLRGDNCYVTRSKFTRDDALEIKQARHCEIGYNLFELPAVSRAQDTDAIFFNLRYSDDSAAGRFTSNIHIYRNLFTTAGISNDPINKHSHAIYVASWWQPEYPPVNSVIEYNLFDNYSRDRLIYLKKGGVTVQYNTVIAVPVFDQQAFKQRAGGGNIWRGNWLEGTGHFDAFHNSSLWIGNKIVGTGGSFRVFAGDNNNHEPATDHIYAWNEGTIRLGYEYYPGDGPFRKASGTRIEAHTGSAQLLTWQEKTTQSSTSSYTQVIPIKLTAADVGPDAR